MFDEDVVARTKEVCPKCGYPLDYDGLIASYVCSVCDYGRSRRSLFPSDFAKGDKMTEGRVPTEPDDSPLVDHAKHELYRAGLYDSDSDYNGMIGQAVQELVETFASQRHSGASAGIVLKVFHRVASYDVLTSVTDNPVEWRDVSETMGKPMWQSTRKPSLLSEDGGKTWWDVNSDETGESERAQ